MAREVCNMVTKGTFKSKEQTYETRYILSFKRFGNEFGIAFFDVTTLEIFIGQFTDDESMSKFRTLVSQIRPVEVVHEREFANSDVVKMLRNSPVVPAMSAMPPNKCFSFIRTCTAIEQYFGEDARKWPEALQTLKDEEKDLAYNAFGMAIAFLTDALIDEQTIVPAHYEIYEPEAKQGTRGL